MRRSHAIKESPAKRRSGVAAVELAVASPLLVLLVMGTLDLGQFINISEIVSNGSRIGARKAVRYETTSVTDVETAVVDHFANHFSMVSRDTLRNATTVTIKNSAGATVTGTGLQNIASKQDVVVEVNFNYSAIRWVGGLNVLDGKSLSCTTTMRRL